MYFYLVLLQNNKYYILFSSNNLLTIDDINDIKNIDWLLINRPIHIVRKIPYSGQNIDDHIYEYMRIYGKQSIRGGKYTNAVLTTQQNMEIDEKFLLDIREPLCDKCEFNKDNEKKQSLCNKLYRIICRKKYTIHEPLISANEC